jgi:hypothetical protein
MLTGVPDVSKWQAARRGVSAFLQDCETVQASATAYVTAGVRTFRQDGANNEFASVFAAPGYGLVKAGGAAGRGVFDSATAAMTASGFAPLAEALQDARAALVDPPFRRVGGERRYLAMFGDGLSTAGAGLASIPDHSLAGTAVFAMGFGVGSNASYSNLASMVAKGVPLGIPQVSHGENAGTIDKFFSNALAHAIGFTTIFDPVFELFEGEHVHVAFDVTSAEETLLLTIQGMDFDDGNWTFHLHGPGGFMAYGMEEGAAHAHDGSCAHACCRRPDVAASRANGRACIVLQRDNADDACWVGEWRLMVAYRAPQLDAMVMPNIGELIQPMSAGPVRGPRYSRLLVEPRERVPVRNIRGEPRHRLDERTAGTNHGDRSACMVVVNIQGRSRLRMELVPTGSDLRTGCELGFALEVEALQGNVTIDRAFARMLSPTHDLAAAVEDECRRHDAGARSDDPKHESPDPALLLAHLEQRDSELTAWRDQELEVMTHGDGPPHMHVPDTTVPGIYHVGLIVEGHYCPMHGHAAHEPAHDHGDHGAVAHASHSHPSEQPAHAADEAACDDDCPLERFTRVLTATVAVQAATT